MALAARTTLHYRNPGPASLRINCRHAGRGFFILLNMRLPNIDGGEYRNERSRARRLLHIRPALRLFALHQTHDTDNVKSKFAGRCDGLNSRGAGGTDVVYNHHPRAFFAETFDALPGSVLLLSFPHKKAVQLSTYYRHRDHNRVR